MASKEELQNQVDALKVALNTVEQRLLGAVYSTVDDNYTREAILREAEIEYGQALEVTLHFRCPYPVTPQTLEGLVVKTQDTLDENTSLVKGRSTYVRRVALIDEIVEGAAETVEDNRGLPSAIEGAQKILEEYEANGSVA